MEIIKVNNWRFVFGHDSALDRALRRDRPPDVFEYDTPQQLLQFLAADKEDWAGRFQTKIRERLQCDKATKCWKRSRSLLRHSPHLREYRRHRYDAYHQAARAVSTNRASKAQAEMVRGLTEEIDASRTEVPIGQVLFHGRANHELTTTIPYPSFVSTSLDPVVAINSALRRAHAGGRPVVYVLKSEILLPAIWGQRGRDGEWEVLLPPKLHFHETNRTSGNHFDIVEAEIVQRS